MKRSHSRIAAKIHALLLLTGLIIFTLSAAPAISQAEEVDLCIIHLNDVHGYLLPYEDKNLTAPPGKVGGAAFIAAKIEEIRKAHRGSCLLLDAGDIAQGTPISNEFRGEPVIEIMNRIGVQATTLGNHEFDWGQDTLRQMLSREKFPCICANLLDAKTGRLVDFIKEPYHIFTVNGIKIGIIGITTPATPRISFEYNVKGLRFEEPEKVLPGYVKELREKGVQLVGVLSHYGLEGDRKMAERVPGIDFIVGGHTHKALMDPLIVNNTIIVQAGAYGMYVGELNLRVDRSTGKIVLCTEKNELHPIIDDQIKPDPAVAAIVDKYYLRLKPIMEEVVGQSGEEIGKSPKPGSGDTPIGDVITDFLRSYSKTDIFFCNSGGLRSPIPKGPITRESIYRVLPFDDFIVTMDLTGQEVLEIIMHGTSSEKMIQVSGVTFSLYPSRSGSERIADVKVGEQPLDLEKTYKVGTINYLSSGGDGYSTFSKGRNVVNDPELIRDVVCRVIKERKTIEMPQEKRIVIVGEPKKS
jgi:2',3'-cyclic-nucleotide 2'-phosphodiesterase (5'-nucleotidase family)